MFLKVRAKEGSANPVFLSSNSKHKVCVIPEIEIWRVAVLMVSRYADEAEANSFQVPWSFARRASLGALRRS